MATQRERRERTVARLVGAAVDLMSERGYDAVSVDEVATQAEVAKGAFYHHFPSKKALLDTVVNGMQAQIAEELLAQRVPGVLTADGLAGALERYIRLATRPDRRRLLLVDGPSVLGWGRWREIDDLHFAGMTRHGLAQILSDVEADALDAATRLLLGAVMEAVLDAGRAPDPEARAALYGRELRRLLGGFATGS